MLLPTLVQLVSLAGLVDSAASSWTRGRAGAVAVTVDTASFAIAVGFPGSPDWLVSGGLAARCRGVRATTFAGCGSNATDLCFHPKAAAAREFSGVGALGAFDAIAQDFGRSDGDAGCDVAVEVRYHAAHEAFTFHADFSAADRIPEVNGTALLSPTGGKGPSSNMGGLATEFPSWPMPDSDLGLQFVTYQGNSLGNNFATGPLASGFEGGLQGGPVLLHRASDTSKHPPSVVFSPLNNAKSLVAMRTGSGRLAVGVSGYVEELPPSFSQVAVLVGRSGLASAQVSWGSAVRAYSGTRRLTLDEDEYSSKITYWTDNGAVYVAARRESGSPARQPCTG